MNKERQLELKKINKQKLIQQENIDTENIEFYKEVDCHVNELLTEYNKRIANSEDSQIREKIINDIEILFGINDFDFTKNIDPSYKPSLEVVKFKIIHPILKEIFLIIRDYYKQDISINGKLTFIHDKKVFSTEYLSQYMALSYYKVLKALKQQKQPQLQISELKNRQPQPEIKSFSDMFTVTGWNKYLDALTECTPKLLKKENDNYTFIGNQKTQRGCIAQWFKYLKAKGIIYQTLNRQEIAKVLSNEIVNFSIVGSSIDNETEFYKTTIHKQLEQYTNNII